MTKHFVATCVLSGLSMFLIDAAAVAAPIENFSVSEDWCDPAADSNLVTFSPVVDTKTGGAVCHAVVDGANSVLGRDPTIGEYHAMVPTGSKEKSVTAWEKEWKDWLHASKTRGNATIHQAYQAAFGRDASDAELDYWRGKKGGYAEMFNGNVTWVKSSAGAKERARIIDQAYRNAAFERAPTDAEHKYWMDHYGSVDAPAACMGGKIDTYSELLCANNEWFWSAASASERSRVVQDAGLLVCPGTQLPNSKTTFEPPADWVDTWANKRVLEDRLSLTDLTLSDKFTEKSVEFCKSTAPNYDSGNRNANKFK